AEHGLSFDRWLYPPQPDELGDLARAFPDTTIVLDHLSAPLGVGPYDNKAPQPFQEWRPLVSALAECPNVVVKLGGLGTAVFGYRFHERDRPPSSLELADAWRPYFEHCIERFGTDRCMFESNFPVDRTLGSYAVVWNA